VLDNVLVNTFGVNGTVPGGSIVITTPAETSLTATARTYNQTSERNVRPVHPRRDRGGVDRPQRSRAADPAGRTVDPHPHEHRRERDRRQTRDGGSQPHHARLAHDAGRDASLQANEYQQFGLASFGLPDAVYNGRVTVKVVSGEGKVTATAAIDQITQDPTYVPAQ
jgi:hypothetical protein